MPFPGNVVGAPVMAAKQGMKDISFAAVTDKATPVLQYVNGPLTGKGSGLLTPVTQTFAGVTQTSMTQASSGAGQTMDIGGGSFSPASGGGGTGPAPAGLSAAAFNALGLGSGGGGGAQSMAAAQAMMSGGGGGAMGSASAMAGSGMGGGAGAGGMGSGAAASAAGAGGAGLSSLPGLTPGQLPGAPSFTALPMIPSLPRLSDVLAQLGGMITGGGASGPGSDALSGTGGSGAEALPASQFGGSAPADPTEEEFT